MIRWREAQRVDVPTIVELIVEGSVGPVMPLPDPDACNRAFDAASADPATEIVVGERDGEIVATYQLTILHNLSLAAACRAMIEDVRVRADVRRHGIGSQLLDDAERRARQAGATLMQFMSNASRLNARRFYEAHGFVPSHVGFKRDLERGG